MEPLDQWEKKQSERCKKDSENEHEKWKQTGGWNQQWRREGELATGVRFEHIDKTSCFDVSGVPFSPRGYTTSIAAKQGRWW